MYIYRNEDPPVSIPKNPRSSRSDIEKRVRASEARTRPRAPGSRGWKPGPRPGLSQPLLQCAQRSPLGSLERPQQERGERKEHQGTHKKESRRWAAEGAAERQTAAVDEDPPTRQGHGYEAQSFLVWIIWVLLASRRSRRVGVLHS